MKKIFAAALVLAVGIVIGVGYTVSADTVYQPSALFDTQLSQALDNISTSTMVLQSGVDKSGNSLTGNMCFTVDGGLSNVEYICGSASGTTISGLTRGIDFTDGVTSNSSRFQKHRIGADVKQSDYPYLSQIARLLNGSGTFPNILQYAPGVSSSSIAGNNQNLVDVALLNSTAFSSVPNGSLTVKGIYQEATQAQMGSGTAVGSTGADLVVSNRYSSLTASTSAVSVTAVGPIDPTFLAGGNYAFGTISATNQTFSGTTSIATATFTNAPSGVTNVWGNGTSTATISASTTLTSDVYYANLTVATSVVLETANFKIFVAGTLTVNGTIDNSGSNGGNASLTTAGSGASAIASGTLPSNIGGHIGGPANGQSGYFNSGGGGGGQGGAGGGSGASGGIVDIFARTIVMGTSGIIQSNGGNGGNGGVGAVGSAGSGSGGCISGGSAPSAPTTTAVLYSIGVNTIATTTNGGSGGTGCGAQGGQTPTLGMFSTSIYLPNNLFEAFSNYNFIASAMNNTSAQAPGGAGGGTGGSVITGSGGSGGGGGGGYGGNGGSLILVYSTLINNGSLNVNGGTGGTGGAAGASGGGIGTAGSSGNTGVTGTIYKIQI
jgi:hypothetical protein